VQPSSEAINVGRVVGAIRRRLVLIVLCAIVVGGAALAYSKHETKKYTATAALSFSSNPLAEQIAGLQATDSANLPAQQASNLELVRLGSTAAAETAALLGHGLTQDEVRSSLSVSGLGESSVVSVSATTTSPVLAAEIANAYSRLFVKEQQHSVHQYFRSALALVHKQLAQMSPVQRIGEDGLNLQNRAQTLGLLSSLNYGNVQMAGQAVAPRSPSSPNVSRNTVLGIVVGLLIGLGLTIVLEHLDGRVRGLEELEAAYRVPGLGVVPRSAALARAGGGSRDALPPVEAEAFNLIRAHLRLLDVDRDLRTVVIASAEPGDGKTTVARHLAEAAARTGSRVLLLEADLRHPTLAPQLGLPSRLGLTDVLIDPGVMADAIQQVALKAPFGEGSSGRTLDVLVAGATPPPNPAELLESNAMATVLDRAKTSYDLVVIDTAPLAVVSDAFPLLTKVDGVVLVGWIGRSRRDAAARLHQVLSASDVPRMGIIAIGAKTVTTSTYVGLGTDTSPDQASAVVGPPSTEELNPASNV
jgi:polysaccharide biosynthesis transport protein